MKRNFPHLLEESNTLADIFEVVKLAVREHMKLGRAGLMLGLADLGNVPNGFFGGFFQIGSNIIVMNRIPLQRIKDTQIELYKPYVFHVLCHEYLHSLNYLDEVLVRKLVFDISKTLFGTDDLTTEIAMDTRKFFPSLAYPNVSWQPRDLQIELVEDFDRSSVRYIG